MSDGRTAGQLSVLLLLRLELSMSCGANLLGFEVEESIPIGRVTVGWCDVNLGEGCFPELAFLLLLMAVSIGCDNNLRAPVLTVSVWPSFPSPVRFLLEGLSINSTAKRRCVLVLVVISTGFGRSLRGGRDEASEAMIRWSELQEVMLKGKIVQPRPKRD